MEVPPLLDLGLQWPTCTLNRRVTKQSLRSTLRDWESSGDLQYVDGPVDPRHELGAVLSLRKHGPEQFFRQVKGYEMPVVGNVLNTRGKTARGLGLVRGGAVLNAVEDVVGPIQCT